jgi:hypothetical protein
MAALGIFYLTSDQAPDSVQMPITLLQGSRAHTSSTRTLKRGAELKNFKERSNF